MYISYIRIWIPDSVLRIPVSGFRTPDSGLRIPDSRLQTPDFRYRISDSGMLAAPELSQRASSSGAVFEFETVRGHPVIGDDVVTKYTKYIKITKFTQKSKI